MVLRRLQQRQEPELAASGEDGERDDVSRAKLFGAFFLIYVVWGSNFLAIRYAVETISALPAHGRAVVVGGRLPLRLGASPRGQTANAATLAGRRRGRHTPVSRMSWSARLGAAPGAFRRRGTGPGDNPGLDDASRLALGARAQAGPVGLDRNRSRAFRSGRPRRARPRDGDGRSPWNPGAPGKRLCVGGWFDRGTREPPPLVGRFGHGHAAARRRSGARRRVGWRGRGGCLRPEWRVFTVDPRFRVHGGRIVDTGPHGIRLAVARLDPFARGQLRPRQPAGGRPHRLGRGR